MHVVRTPGSARAIARTLARPLGFVPTMGALHRGHRALIERARAENASVAVSIFVNPLQFGPGEDYDRYPRAFESDKALLESAGVDLLYAPDEQRIYPPEFATNVDTGELGRCYEGAARPGHFNGVATIVAKLLHALEPTSVYFGQKDVQQTAVIRAMVRDLDMAQSVIVCPTVREPDGLALSSRNVYLDARLRAAAPTLHAALSFVASALERGETSRDAVLNAAAALIAAPLSLEYLDVVDAATFEPLQVLCRPALALGVVRAGRVRLLDNVSIPGADGVDPVLTPLRALTRTP